MIAGAANGQPAAGGDNIKSRVGAAGLEIERARLFESVFGLLKKEGGKSADILETSGPADFEVLFQGETALVCFTLHGRKKAVGSGAEKYGFLDVFARRGTEWVPAGGNPRLQNGAAIGVSPEARKFILSERDKVWQAWFGNDQAALEKAIPEEIVVISPGGGAFRHRAEILSSSEKFVKSGARLVRLEFSNDEIQVYGATVILYTNYLYEVESGGKKEITAGRATDMFVIRDGAFVNVGWHLDSGR